MSETAEQEEDMAEGSLLSHLVELRNRLIKMVAAVIVLFAVLIPFNQKIFGIVSAPLLAAVPRGEMIAIGTISNVLVPFKLTFFVALMLAMPVILYQVWAFVAPGLYRKEKRFAFPLLASSVALFYIGALFAYYVVFPLIFGFLASIEIDGAPWVPDIASYLDTITSIVLAFGLAFEVPIATLLLVWTGITSPATLGKARPYVFLGAFVVGMLLTPPDVISQTLLAVPVYLLYEAGIIMSRMFAKKTEKDAEPSEK
ncbi:MAG: twin-arginine translocase subunit TatC [Woeseiaceae bacterium]